MSTNSLPVVCHFLFFQTTLLSILNNASREIRRYLLSCPLRRLRASSLVRSIPIMGFLHLFIVNKSGGLILHRPLGPRAPSIGTNEWLRIGSTFHSLHAIAAEAGPVRLPGNKNPCELNVSMLCERFFISNTQLMSRFFLYS